MGYIIGGFDGLLPYSKEIDRCATEGGMFKAITYCNPKYTAWDIQAALLREL